MVVTHATPHSLMPGYCSVRSSSSAAALARTASSYAPYKSDKCGTYGVYGRRES